MSLWNELGFSDNPYSPRPITADEQGEALLVGRDKELKRLTTYLRSSATHPTLEGPNGVGKTSLVSVAGFRLKQDFIDQNHQQAMIPIAEPFQLTTEDTAASFKRRVFFKVAQTIIENHDLLKSRGFDVPDIEHINNWLNSPVFSNVGGGIGVFQVGSINATKGTTVNTGAGFTEDGFISAVSMWLKKCFPTAATGGFIAVIDNLELLETSKTARSLLEAIRDEVLGIHGLRWVLCGARGIIRSVASSPRLQGVIAEPINIDPIAHEHIQPLIAARLKYFKVSDSAIPPVEANGFNHIYTIGNNNLRNAMKYSEDFSFWAVDNSLDGKSSEEKLTMLETWMQEVSSQYEQDTSGVGKRAWQLFDKLAEIGGSTSPSEFEIFGFESTQAMRPHLRALEESNLIESAIDESDNRRKTISISSRGWIVNYKRSGFKAEQKAADPDVQP